MRWNAYHQGEAMQGQPLYGAPPALVGADYPPLSFHLIGLASRLTGNVNQTGRWVALLSLALVALLCGAIVRRFTGSTPLAAFAALSAVIWVAVYEPDRIGMNDPQLLGSVFSLLGLYAYLRERENRLWLCISALAFTLSVFTKHNLLAFPAAVGLHAAFPTRARLAGFILGGTHHVPAEIDDGTGLGLLPGFFDHEVAMDNGILVLAIGEAEIGTPDGGVLTGERVYLLGIQIAMVGEVVLAGKDAVAGDRADGLQQRARFRRRIRIHRLAIVSRLSLRVCQHARAKQDQRGRNEFPHMNVPWNATVPRFRAGGACFSLPVVATIRVVRLGGG